MQSSCSCSHTLKSRKFAEIGFSSNPSHASLSMALKVMRFELFLFKTKNDLVRSYKVKIRHT